MAPDLNSLPPSRSPSIRPSNSQQNAANSGNSPDILRSQHGPTSSTGPSPPVGSSPRHRGSPRMERRRSSMLATWALNDGAGVPPSPGASATADPFHHHRTPSLGELHQELENEQEAQVNRLLAMIREQQGIITQYQNLIPSSTSAEEGGAAAATSQPNTGAGAPTVNAPLSISGQQPSVTTQMHLPPSRRASTARSRTPSRTGSPIIRPNSRQMISSSTTATGGTALYTPQSETGGDWPSHSSTRGGERDEVSLVQQEAAMLQRENLMLKARIGELERRLAQMEGLGLHMTSTGAARQSGHTSFNGGEGGGGAVEERGADGGSGITADGQASTATSTSTSTSTTTTTTTTAA